MQWELFWAALGAIGQLLGAAATFSAVVVSLWLARNANKVRLRLTASNGVQHPSPNVDVPTLRIDVVNGPVVAYPLFAHLEFPNGQKHAFDNPVHDGEITNQFMNRTLLPNQNMAFEIPLAKVTDIAGRFGYSGITPITIVIKDSTGAEHQCVWALPA